jgi:hypothetical protein
MKRNTKVMSGTGCLGIGLVLVCCALASRSTPTNKATNAAASSTRTSAPTRALTITPSPSPGQMGLAFVVGNTDNEGAYIRASTVMTDRIRGWPDGTSMVQVGLDREVDGRLWRNVQAPDGTIGWIPADYLIEAPPPSPTPRESATPKSTNTALAPTRTAVPAPVATEIAPTAVPTLRPTAVPVAPPSTGCCKVCRTGKACGDSCIAANKTCHKGRGCACDG